MPTEPASSDWLRTWANRPRLPHTHPAATASDQSAIEAVWPTLLVEAAATAGYDLDLEELTVATADDSQAVIDLVTAAAALATHRYTRRLLSDTLNDLAAIIGSEPDEIDRDRIANLAATLGVHNNAGQTHLDATAVACRRLHATGLGFVSPAHPAPVAGDEPGAAPSGDAAGV